MTKNKESNLLEVAQETYKVPISTYNGRYTKSALFLLPMLGLDVRNVHLTKYMENVFINDAELEHKFNCPIFILFKVKNLTESGWIDLQRMFRTKEGLKDKFVFDYDLGFDTDGNFLIMYVCEIAEICRKDYYYFKRGKYSKFSDAYKKLFPKEVMRSGKICESDAYGAIYRTVTRKNTVAKEFTPHDAKGNIINPSDYIQFRTFVDTLDELYDAPKAKHEVYRYKQD
jgi:hypothetical protein